MNEDFFNKLPAEALKVVVEAYKHQPNGWTDQNYELSRFNFDRQILDGHAIAIIFLPYAVESNFCHTLSPLHRTRDHAVDELEADAQARGARARAEERHLREPEPRLAARGEHARERRAHDPSFALSAGLRRQALVMAAS